MTLGTTVSSVLLGATIIERHITLDRNMEGSDHSGSVTPHGLFKLVSGVRELEQAYGDGKITVTESEKPVRKKLRGWLNKKDVKPIAYKEKNLFRKISIFKNIRYKWGGKSFQGIDCSALIQIFLNFNNKFCPRDAKDQVKYFKKMLN